MAITIKRITKKTLFSVASLIGILIGMAASLGVFLSADREFDGGKRAAGTIPVAKADVPPPPSYYGDSDSGGGGY